MSQSVAVEVATCLIEKVALAKFHVRDQEHFDGGMAVCLYLTAPLVKHRIYRHTIWKEKGREYSKHHSIQLMHSLLHTFGHTLLEPVWVQIETAINEEFECGTWHDEVTALDMIVNKDYGVVEISYPDDV